MGLAMEPVDFVFDSLEKGNNTVFAIAVDTGLTMPAVTQCLAALVEDGEVRRDDSGPEARFVLKKKR
jgi:DNA-binding IclR family transcriptional regulator